MLREPPAPLSVPPVSPHPCYSYPPTATFCFLKVYCSGSAWLKSPRWLPITHPITYTARVLGVITHGRPSLALAAAGGPFLTHALPELLLPFPNAGLPKVSLDASEPKPPPPGSPCGFSIPSPLCLLFFSHPPIILLDLTRFLAPLPLRTSLEVCQTPEGRE